MNTDFQSILKLLLPEFLIDNFQIMKVEEIAQRIDVYLEENRILPSEFKQPDYISHGFHKQTKIKDFPIRGKQVTRYIKRRRWLNKTTNEVISKDWNLITKGTRMTEEFETFLKGIN